MRLDLPGFPALPTAQELWWVAVERAQDPSGGWLVFADPGSAGARQIQSTFEQAQIAILAAVDAQSLHHALGSLDVAAPIPETAIAWRQSGDRLVGSVEPGTPGEVLCRLRLENPDDLLLFVESQDAVHALDRRMQQLLELESFEGVRMDLRVPPRGQGAWGLALVRTQG